MCPLLFFLNLIWFPWSQNVKYSFTITAKRQGNYHRNITNYYLTNVFFAKVNPFVPLVHFSLIFPLKDRAFFVVLWMLFRGNEPIVWFLTNVSTYLWPTTVAKYEILSGQAIKM